MASLASYSSPRAKVEFQAIILTNGDDSSLYPLTQTGTFPRSLIPVANRPLLVYQLNLLENVGFEEVIVVVSDQYKDAIGEYLALAREEGLTTMNVSLSVVGESVGTAESLRLLNDKINGDFFVIHGDLVAEGVLNKLADLHRTKQSTVTMLLKDLRASQVEKKTDKKSGKKKKDDKPKRKKVKAGPDGPTFIGFDRNDNRVFYEKSINDMEEENPKIVVPKALLRRRPNIYVTDEMEDVRLYIFSRRVMDLLMAQPDIVDIHAELIPRLLHIQFRGPMEEFLKENNEFSLGDGTGLLSVGGNQGVGMASGQQLPVGDSGSDGVDGESMSSIITGYVGPPSRPLSRTLSIRSVGSDFREGGLLSPSRLSDGEGNEEAASVYAMSSRRPIPRVGGDDEENGPDRVRVFAHILPPSTPLYCNRLAQLKHYIPLNQSLYKSKQGPTTPWKRIESNEGFPKYKKAGSLIGQNVTIGTKCTIKNSVIGDHCRIGNNVKINNSVLMNHVCIKDGSTVQNSILCSNANLGEKCNFNDCQIGAGTIVEDGKIGKSEVFTSHLDEISF